MQLGLGLGLGLQKPTLSPVSNWPTIADIPQGAVVLDTDGVAKRKIDDYLVDIQYNVIGSGPLASAPAASANNAGLFYMSADFGLCVCRSVASDYVGAYASLNTAPCLHLESWSVSFAVNAESQTDAKVYGEGDQVTGRVLLTIGTGTADGKRLRVFLRDSESVIRADTTFDSLIAFDSKWHYVTVSRSGNSLTATIDGASQTKTGLFSGVIAGTATTSTIGAVRRLTVMGDFTGFICNFKKCTNAPIPLQQTSGTNVLDAAGTVVGTVTAPALPWWDYSWVPWSLLQ